MIMKEALIVGGSNGIGLAIVNSLQNYDRIYVLDKSEPELPFPKNVFFEQFDLTNFNCSILKKYLHVNTLIITAGIGKLELFQNITDDEIVKYFNINTISIIRIVRLFYSKLLGKTDFYCGIMVSIAGFMSSPFFSVYGATKAALKIFIESVNVELIKSGTSNRILNISPGSIQGTKFSNGINNLSLTIPLAEEIIQKLHKKEDLFIPQYEEIFKQVLERYHQDFRAEGIHSYEYKIATKRIK